MKKLTCALLSLLALTSSFGYAVEPERYCVYYNDQADASEFSAYDLVVLDQEYHPPMQGFIDQGITTLGYISLGEVGDYRWYFNTVKRKNLLLFENPNFPGSWFIDIRKPRWKSFVLNTIIPYVMYQGFDGLFYDTLDNAAYLEGLDPIQYMGMVDAAIDLVQTIRAAYPTLPIMMNRAYDILDDVGNDIDMELGEEVYTRYNFATQLYELVPQQDYDFQVNILQSAQAAFPALKVYTLDYWLPIEQSMIADIYELERNNGFIPYVSTVALDSIVAEPPPGT